jgi:hypothetical protein
MLALLSRDVRPLPVLRRSIIRERPVRCCQTKAKRLSKPITVAIDFKAGSTRLTVDTAKTRFWVPGALSYFIFQHAVSRLSRQHNPNHDMSSDCRKRAIPRSSSSSRIMSSFWRRSIHGDIALRKRDFISLRPPLKLSNGAHGASSVVSSPS